MWYYHVSRALILVPIIFHASIAKIVARGEEHDWIL